VAGLAASGRITGGGPVDPDLRRTWGLDHEPYSIRLGGKWLGYKRLDPVFMPVGILADFSDIVGHLPDHQAGTLAYAVQLAIARNIMSRTWATNLENALSAAAGKENAMKAFAEGVARSTVPTAVRSTARTGFPITTPAGAVVQFPGDPYMKEVRSLMDAVMSGIPGWSRTVSPIFNLYGDPILTTGGIGPDMVSPLYVSPVHEDPVAAEVERLGVTITKPPRVIFGRNPDGLLKADSPANGIPLNNQQYAKFVRMAGQPLKAALPELIKSDAYRAASDDPVYGKGLLIRNKIDQYRQIAQARLIAEDPALLRAVDERGRERAVASAPDFLRGVLEKMRMAP